jgi:UDPglucose--hexose-1-phosphate uridylyltransferase
MVNTMIDAALEIERLIRYALDAGLIERWDVVPVRNSLMELLRVTEPAASDPPDDGSSLSEILNRLLDLAAGAGLIEQDTAAHRDLFDTKIMGLLMPRQSEVVRRFRAAASVSIEKATDDFYRLARVSNYIRTDRAAKDLHWKTPSRYGDVDITINLAKPEKDPKDIAAAGCRESEAYPKCLLCLENAGYAGREDYPARQNLRFIPVTLGGEQWFMQYSPYAYYNEHCIVFSREHRPMKLTTQTLGDLLDFTEQFPHYFIGVNADLPIVGGSILSHDHFQGGRYVFPMERAPVAKVLRHGGFPGIRAGVIKWPMTVIRIAGKDRSELRAMATHILEQWKRYEDPDAGILAYSAVNGEKTPHNTVTPICRKNGSGEFEMDMVLRNNRASPEHPYGIFHPHAELHHIKKENIGLIEVMGLAVLPGRLNEEIRAIESFLEGRSAFDESAIGEDDPLAKHIPWIKDMLGRFGTDKARGTARKIIEDEVGRIFIRVLEDAGVFKSDDAGEKALLRCLEHMQFQVK